MSANIKPRKSNANCSVIGCNLTYQNSNDILPKVTFHRFPALDIKRRQEWVRFAKRINADGTDWQPTKYSLICSRHFVGNKPVNEKVHVDYVPSLYPITTNSNRPRPMITRKVPNDNSRFERSRRRAMQNSQVNKLSNFNNITDDIDMIELPPLPASPPPKFCEIACQTDESPIDFANGPKGRMYFFISNDNGHEASTQVQHDAEVDQVERAVGNDYEVPSFFGYSSIEQQEDKEAKLEHLTTVNSDIFLGFVDALNESGYRPRSNRVEDFLLLFFIKLKHDISFRALAVFFSMKLSTVKDNFYHILNRLFLATPSIINWPTSEEVKLTLPNCFRADYSNCRAIIDCFEVKCDKPKSIKKANALYSSYKSAHTIKVLIAVTPNGQISFLSEAYGGRTSDGLITNMSGLLDLLSPGDLILADKGFPVIDIQEVITAIPPRKDRKQYQFSPKQLSETEKIASKRIHVERVIQRVKTFDILANRLHHTMLPHINKIVHICAVLVNLQSKIIRSKPNQTEDLEDEDAFKLEEAQFDESDIELLDQCLFRDKVTEDKDNTNSRDLKVLHII